MNRFCFQYILLRHNLAICLLKLHFRFTDTYVISHLIFFVAVSEIPMSHLLWSCSKQQFLIVPTMPPRLTCEAWYSVKGRRRWKTSFCLSKNLSYKVTKFFPLVLNIPNSLLLPSLNWLRFDRTGPRYLRSAPHLLYPSY